MMNTRSLAVLILLALLAACNSSSDKSANAEIEPNTKTADTKTEENVDAAIPEGQPFEQPGDYAASHILIAYAGAMRANPQVTRTKEEAKVKAEQLIARLNEEPEIFTELAKLESDGPSGPRGGSLGVFQKGAMVKPFEDALATMEIGDISKTPVETDFGYHVIRRDTRDKLFWAADAFIIAFKGPRTPPNISREKADAEALANEIKTKLNRGNFDALAAENNDFQEGSAMFLGAFSEDAAPSPEMMEGLKNAQYGDVIGPIELPVGYAFIRRVPVEQRAGSHILISYKGAQNASPEITRTKEEAYARAQELIDELKDKVDEFGEYASKFSDGPSKTTGGSLGTWFKGKMVPEFEKALDTMEIGTITPECVETAFGYHIILKEDPKAK